ncbi:hypothetical protein QBC46DRAFT_447978 [Diplogelasinospora grovesii]|uniref:Uncharacterized protein n=1 Tax=Diplogelasinospora grovesii TaxID=303347 RepID=A0AAN6S5Y0_9PEZI|nr:hypothetical protein QBC46DRAFT_447978 [Diplogelasinospora grovesii]
MTSRTRKPKVSWLPSPTQAVTTNSSSTAANHATTSSTPPGKQIDKPILTVRERLQRTVAVQGKLAATADGTPRRLPRIAAAAAAAAQVAGRVIEIEDDTPEPIQPHKSQNRQQQQRSEDRWWQMTVGQDDDTPVSAERVDFEKVKAETCGMRSPDSVAEEGSHQLVQTQRRRVNHFPDTDYDKPIRELREYYRNKVDEALDTVVSGLQQAQAHFNKHLQTISDDNETFLKAAEEQAKHTCAPLSSFKIRSQKRSPDGTVKNESMTVKDLSSAAHAQIESLGKKIFSQWKQWEQAHLEVKKARQEIIQKETSAAETLETFRAGIEKDIKNAGKEAKKLGDAVMMEAKHLEKDYRKATVPDLLIFHKSINDMLLTTKANTKMRITDLESSTIYNQALEATQRASETSTCLYQRADALGRTGKRRGNHRNSTQRQDAVFLSFNNNSGIGKTA